MRAARGAWSTSGLNVLSLFAGIGGLELGLERAGMTTVGQVEIEKSARFVLAKHWPDVPKHDDVRTAIDWWLSRKRPVVDVICGGFPCQPFSLAGSRKGTADERWGWPWFADVVRALSPRYVLIENVPGLLRSPAFLEILGDCAEMGFDAEWGIVSACSMGAPHTRERLFILAHATGERGGQCGWVEQPENSYPQRNLYNWKAVPEPHRVADGISHRMDRLRALGNAVVPQVAELVGQIILSIEGQMNEVA